MKNLIILFTIIIIATQMSSCKKKTPTIDDIVPITQNGENTFACKINGKIVYTLGHANSLSTDGVEVNFYPLFFGLKAITEEPRNDFYFEIKYDGNLGSYPVLSRIGSYKYNTSLYMDVNHSGNIPGGTNTCQTVDSTKGCITITKNNAKVFAGTFAFDMLAGDSSIVHITEGRFDIEKE
jgi:hypothetical protein